MSIDRIIAITGLALTAAGTVWGIYASNKPEPVPQPSPPVSQTASASQTATNISGNNNTSNATVFNGNNNSNNSNNNSNNNNSNNTNNNIHINPTTIIIQPGKNPSQSPTTPVAVKKPIYHDYLEESYFSGKERVNLVAIQGDQDVATHIVKNLHTPLTTNAFKEKFFSSGIFRRTLNGNGTDIQNLNLPTQISKLILIHTTPTEKKEIAELQGAYRMISKFKICVVSAGSGQILQSSEIQAQGVGFNERALLTSLQEDLEEKLRPVRQEL